MKLFAIGCIFALFTMLVGCTATQQGAGIGAALGAGAGALIGHGTHAGSGTGALVGAAVGGLGGALAGDAVGQHRAHEAAQDQAIRNQQYAPAPQPAPNYYPQDIR